MKFLRSSLLANAVVIELELWPIMPGLMIS